MTAREELYPRLIEALRECMSTLDMCINSSNAAAAFDEADRVLTKYRPLLQQIDV